MNLSSFFSELKRRNVYKVAITYGVVSWLLIQAASILLPTFEAPAWVMKALVVFLAFGFIISVMISWAFEATPEGLKRTEDVPPDVAAKLPTWSPRKFAAFVIGVAVIAAGLLAFNLWRNQSAATPPNTASAAPTEAAAKSIAVLPFVNMGADKADEYLSDGVSEELITALSRITGLQVKARTSSFAFKGKNEDIQKIGELLRVSHLLEGSVARSGNKLRITAQLIQAADGNHVWSDTYDREMQDIFAVRSEVAKQVAETLKIRLLGEDKKQLEKKPTENIEAHNAYLLGRYHLQRRNIEDYRKAVGHYDEAIRLDPQYALAYAERSEAWTLIGDLSGESKTAWPKARSDAEHAVAIAPVLAEAHGALGWVRFFAEWKFAEGLKELRQAKEISPENPTANDLLGRVLPYLGKLDEAEAQARQAVELDPLGFTQNNLARILWFKGKNDEADKVARRVAELQPNAASSRRWQVLIAVQHGDGETALREAQLEPDEGYRRFLLALAHYARGDHNAADATLSDLIQYGRDQLAYQIAEVYAVRGDTDKAFKWLQIAYENHDTGLLAILVDPLLHDLRDDPRYKALVTKMNFPATP